MGQVRNRFRKSSVAAVVAVVALFATACGGGTSTEAGSEASSDPLVIGISLPLTGDFSQPGGAAKKGYEVWANMVNASGGILNRQVELKILDDASSQEQVVTDYNRLITEDKVPLILGTFKNPAPSPMSMPPGNVNLGIDCQPPSFKARAPYAILSPFWSKAFSMGWVLKRCNSPKGFNQGFL
jgi:hypothetical protein